VRAQTAGHRTTLAIRADTTANAMDLDRVVLVAHPDLPLLDRVHCRSIVRPASRASFAAEAAEIVRTVGFGARSSLSAIDFHHSVALWLYA